MIEYYRVLTPFSPIWVLYFYIAPYLLILACLLLIGVIILRNNKKRLQRKLWYIEWNIESAIDSINANIEEYIIKQYIKWKTDHIILLYITRKGIIKIKYYYKTGEIK